MELFEVVLNIDQYLFLLIKRYGFWVYLILFLVVFAETGLVITPFLPGESLLFVSGVVAASGLLSIEITIPLLFLAALLGNLSNYKIGNFLGPKIFSVNKIRFIAREDLQKTKDFYDRHGGKAVFISRFLPFFRTLVPFVAGISHMKFLKFFGYNLAGGAIWVLTYTLLGYYLGNIPIIKGLFT